MHGTRTNRWGDSAALQYSTETLPQLPKTIGDWVGEDIEPSEEQIRTYVKAELRVAVVRTYTNRESGDRISIMAVCGPSGAIGTHTSASLLHGRWLSSGRPAGSSRTFRRQRLGASPTTSGLPTSELLTRSPRSVSRSTGRTVRALPAATGKPPSNHVPISPLIVLSTNFTSFARCPWPVFRRWRTRSVRDLFASFCRSFESTVFAPIDDQASASSLLR